MIVSIHQPNYFPYYGYFHKIKNSDLFVFLDNVTYSKNSYINRNRIKMTQGWKWLTVPVARDNLLNTEIKDVSIANVADWQSAHLRMIRNSYEKSKYFQQNIEVVESIFDDEWSNLCDLNMFAVEKMSSAIGIKGNFVRASELGVCGKKSELVFNICKAVGADTYFSGSSGKKYNDESKFKENGINIVYQDFKHPVYQQPYGDFVPYLSILDLFFNMKVGEYLC